MSAQQAVTPKQIEAALATVLVIGDTIRDLGEIPAGHLYAQVMGHLGIESFDAAIDCLVRAGLVRRDNSHLLRWVGPKLES